MSDENTLRVLIVGLFNRIVDSYGVGYTVEQSQIPENAEVDDQYAYRVEIWGNDSGVAYDLKED